jgi:hypothetical protein
MKELLRTCLAQVVGRQRALLILDGVEALQESPGSREPGRLKDSGVAELLKGLATSSLGLCIVTTRYSIPGLRDFHNTSALSARESRLGDDATAQECELKRLSRLDGIELLKSFGVHGDDREFERLVEDVQGHALTLALLGRFLKRAYNGDISRRDCVSIDDADRKIEGGLAFRAMATYEQWLLEGGDLGRRQVAILKLLGLFDRPADASCLAALRRTPIRGLTEPLDGLAEDDWEFSLTGLESAKLVIVNRDALGTLVSLDIHPLLREYFAGVVRDGRSCGPSLSEMLPPIVSTSAWQTAHKRLYE